MPSNALPVVAGDKDRLLQEAVARLGLSPRPGGEDGDRGLAAAARGLLSLGFTKAGASSPRMSGVRLLFICEDLGQQGDDQVRPPLGTGKGANRRKCLLLAVARSGLREGAAPPMKHKQVRRLGVLGRNGRLVGIVSLGDLAVETRDEDLAGETLRAVSEPAVSRR